MGADLISLGFVAGLDSSDASLSVHDLLQELKTHPLVRRLLEGGERVGWGAKAIPEGGFWSLPASVSPPGAVHLRRRRGLRQRAEAEGRALRAALGHARRRDDLRGAAAAGRRRRRRPGALGAVRRAGARERDLERPAPRAQHAPGVPEGPRRGRRARRDDGHDARRAAPRAASARRPTPSARCSTARARYPAPDGVLHVRQALERLPLGQPLARRPAGPHPHPEARAPRRRAGLGRDVPRERLRGLGRGGRGRPRRGAGDAVELRPVRRDHGQGRAPDRARGRLRARSTR